ncbi:Shedu anti-phage system protein SduA domain-containing protein [Streptomyces sp. S584]|uniref:Shedu anti-phage system protein SduA domain-containing protein n=1 Tax=Streptomyces sp. S584 TaxID=3096010 RepID=UPI002AFF5C8F|nr:Shedu anti-phage system protein SduA domain-containing protein [Streptomyces sp. S584]
MKYWLMVTGDKSVPSGAARSLEAWDPSLSTVTGRNLEVGDPVLVWRGGRGGGVVAIGEIASTSMVPPGDFLSLARSRRDEGGSVPALKKAALDLGKLMLATPISADRLRAAGITRVVRQARSAGGDHKLVPLELPEKVWREVIRLAEDPETPTEWPAAWNISPGSVVRRAKLHEVYGGNPRCTIGSSAKTPNALLFVDGSRSGELEARWNGSVLLAPGQGQWGDGISQENLAALAHLQRGVPVRVFLVRGVDCLYVGEFCIDPKQPIERWVVTGKREIQYLDDVLRWDVRTPILRLRLVNGARALLDDPDPFRQAPQVKISLHPSTDQPVHTTIRGLLAVMENDPTVAASLSELGEVQLLGALAQRARRQADLVELRAAAEDSGTSEGDLQKLVQRMTWIFGGEFLPGTARRNLTLRDQLDLTLLRPDGTLHGVELKKANVDRLVAGHRNHLIVGHEINKAVGQAMNYLRELDEKRSQLLVDLGIDARRASMTVVIGHSAFVTNGTSSAQIDETIRTYNSHLTRVSVFTYDRLIENAQRTLDLTTSPGV